MTSRLGDLEDLGVRAAVDGQVCIRDVAGFWAGDERIQCGNIIDVPVPLERRICDLREKMLHCVAAPPEIKKGRG